PIPQCRHLAADIFHSGICNGVPERRACCGLAGDPRNRHRSGLCGAGALVGDAGLEYGLLAYGPLTTFSKFGPRGLAGRMRARCWRSKDTPATVVATLTFMEITNFDDLLTAARQQPEPQRLLFVF